MALERTPSLHSLKGKATNSESGVYSARSFGDVEKLVFFQRQRQLDMMSDTSSQQERKFANLLGGQDDYGAGSESTGTIQNIGHRLYHLGTEKEKMRQEQLRHERERILMSEMTELTQRPAITSRAREKPPKGHLFAEHASEWRKRRDQKVEEQAQLSRQQAESEVTGEPLLNSHSLTLLDESGNYQDPVTGWEKHYAKYCAKHTAPLPKSLFHPNINSNAVRADSDIPIHDRLYKDSTERRMKLKEAARERMKQELEDPATGRPYFSPQSLRPPSQSHVSPNRTEEKSVFEYLHESSKRKELSQQDVDPEATFTPKINPKSDELAERVRKPLYTPGRSARKSEDDSDSKSPDSKEKEAEKAARINKAALEEFFRRTERNDHVRQARLEQLRKERLERDGEHCSFQPRINKHSVDLFEAAHVYGKPMSTPAADIVPTSSRVSGYEASGMSSPSPTQASKKSLQTTPRTTGAPSPKAGAASPKAAAPNTNYSAARGAQRYSPSAVPHSVPAPSVSQGPQDMAGGEDYISNFEKQMYAVLDEWRRLEEV